MALVIDFLGMLGLGMADLVALLDPISGHPGESVLVNKHKV